MVTPSLLGLSLDMVGAVKPLPISMSDLIHHCVPVNLLEETVKSLLFSLLSNVTLCP